MLLPDVILVAIRWTHMAAAVVVVGGSLFYVAVLLPALQSESSSTLNGRIELGYREILDVCLLVLLLSGAILIFERLSNQAAGTLYVLLLVVKLGLAVAFYRLALIARRRGLAARPGVGQSLVALGGVILLVALALRAALERPA